MITAKCVLFENEKILNERALFERKLNSDYKYLRDFLNDIVDEILNKYKNTDDYSNKLYYDVLKELKRLLIVGSDTTSLVGKAYVESTSITTHSKNEIESLLTDKDVAKYMDFSTFNSMGMIFSKLFTTKKSNSIEIRKVLLNKFGMGDSIITTNVSQEDKDLIVELEELLKQNYKTFCFEFYYNLFVSLSMYVPKSSETMVVDFLRDLRLHCIGE